MRKNKRGHDHGSVIRILGVMTGTSCDGLDAACLEIQNEGWSPLWSQNVPYPRQLRERVLAIQEPRIQTSLSELLALDRDLGKWYGKALASMIDRTHDRPHVIANHAQTIAHYPFLAGGGTTLQLGNPAEIAKVTGLTVVSQFRAGDMAAGGQGAPLVPLFHSLIAHQLSDGKGEIAIHNIGGISNLTYLGRRLLEIVAFDTGPGNIWIDAAVQKLSRNRLRFDMDGRIAASATADEKGVRRILKERYFGKKAPKSTGRDDFPFELLLKATRAFGPALVATATEITARSIADAYKREILRKQRKLHSIYFCGGGAKNETLLARIQTLLPEIEVLTLDETGLDGQLIEAQAFAYYGWLALNGHPIGGPWTGSKSFGPPAQITPGHNWDEVIRLINPS